MIVRLDATAEEAQSGIFVALEKLYKMNLDGSALTVVYDGFPKVEQLAMNVDNDKLMITTWYSGSSVLGYDPLLGGDPGLISFEFTDRLLGTDLWKSDGLAPVLLRAVGEDDLIKLRLPEDVLTNRMFFLRMTAD